MSGRWKSRKLIGAMGAIIAGSFFVHEARGNRAYLPDVGPPPLRFVEEITNCIVSDGKLAVPVAKSAETNSSAADLAAKSKVMGTNNVEVAKQNQTPSTIQSPSAMTPAVANGNKSPSQYYNSDFSSTAASDLLTVTPQMINEYLKPDRNRSGNANFDQPGVVVFVPAGIQFTPPAPKASGESRATYHSQ